ncbi:MAG: dihydrolipoyl dehydrogenase [Desulfobacterales bacterium]
MVMGEFTEEADVLIIGGGSGGYAAAFRASDLGKKVTLVDIEKRPGGVCLFSGCIPSKTYLYVSELIQETRQAKQMGVSFGEPEIDLAGLRKWKDKVVDKLANGLVHLSEKRGVRLIQGKAVFEGSDRVRILESESEISHVKFRHAVIATGSFAASLPNMTFSEKSRIMNSSAALALPDIPETMLVIGGGYVGVEMGSVYASLGSRVTMVEMADRIMSSADADMVDILMKKLNRLFENIHTGSRIENLEESENKVKVTFAGNGNEGERSFDRVLVAIGRRPNTENLGLENTRVQTDEKGFIIVDETMRTGDDNIYAIGDAVGGMMLAHKARYEGKVAVEVIAGEPSAYDVRAIPAVVYTDPQLAWCGLTQQEAEAINRRVKISRFPWKASGRAASMGLSDGMTKIIVDDETGRVLGMGIVGKEAGEMIAEGVLAVELGALAEDLALTVHPHPTLSEGEEEAAEAFLGSSTHILPRKRRSK